MIQLSHKKYVQSLHVTTHTDQGRWTGICFNILDVLKDEVNFTYQVVTNEDFGNLNESSGRWTGIIGDVAHNGADMAVQIITTSRERSDVSPVYISSCNIPFYLYGPL